MPPKSLVKSMQAYARSLDNALEMIDDVLSRVPAEGATPRMVLSELEEAKATAKAKYEKMDANYDTQSVSTEMTDEMELAHTKVYDEAKGRYKGHGCPQCRPRCQASRGHKCDRPSGTPASPNH